MDGDDATTRGTTGHRIVHSIETLCRGLGALGVPPATAEKLAGAYALKLEAIRWWEARGYDMSHVPLVGEDDRNAAPDGPRPSDTTDLT